MGKTRELELQNLLSVAQASYLVYQVSHWKVKGDDYYGDHLLLQRLYESAQDYVDQLGERLVGLESSGAIDVGKQASGIALVVNQVVKQVGEDPMKQSMKITQELLAELQDAYKNIKSDDQMTLGLDDLVMSISNTVETNMYLLKQATAPGSRHGAKKNPGTRRNAAQIKRRLMR